MRAHCSQVGRYIGFGIGFLFLASLTSLFGCGKEDLGGPGKVSSADLARLDQASDVVTFDNGEYGFRINFDASEGRWIEVFEGHPGEIRRSDLEKQLLKSIIIDGRDFREFFDSRKGYLARSNAFGSVPFLRKDQGVDSSSVDALVREFHIVGEKSGVKVLLSFPLSGSLIGLRIESDHQHQVSVKSIGQNEPEIQWSLGPTTPFLTYLGQVEVSRMPVMHGLRLPVRIDGPEEDIRAIDGLAFRLATARPLAPFGLTSERYGGHVFWDADLWSFPAMCLVDPEGARRISQFRTLALPQAIENSREWLRNSRPVAGEKQLGEIKIFPGKPFDVGAKFPWESGIDGRELGVTDTRFQEHITADVAWMFQRADALGLVPDSPTQMSLETDSRGIEDAFSLIEHYYRQRITLGEPCELKSTVSASEWHSANNDLFTNSLLDTLFEFKMKLPRDETTFLSFDGDKLGEYQQAAALLAVFPVQHPEVEKEAGAMLDRFAGKVAKEGPAMSHSISASIAARLGRTEEAYEYWKKSWQLYTDDPLLRFREKAVSGDSYFYTGAAGCMNAVYYGFMGLRIDPYEPQDKPWKLKLKNGFWLSAEPHLPAAWKRLQVDIFVLGKGYRLVATRGGFTVEPRPS